MSTTSFPAATQTQSSPSTTTTTGSLYDSAPGSISGYYFVFFAVLLCIIAFTAYTLIRRRRALRYGQRRAGDSERGGARTIVGGERANHQPWIGRWRSAEHSREGLNELGEAPPAYVAKSSEELRRGAGAVGVGESHSGPEQQQQQQHGPASIEPAVPLQTLSRQSAGLKPPDYEEREVSQEAPGHGSSQSHNQSSRDPS